MYIFWGHFIPVQATTEHQVESSVLHSRFSLAIYFIHSDVRMSTPVSQFIPPHTSHHGVHSFILYVSVSISALQIGSSVPFF